MHRGAVSLEQLFDPEFLESLQRLRLDREPRAQRRSLRRAALGGSWGSGHRVPRLSAPTRPATTCAAIDWNIYRRLGRVFLRLFEELEDLPVYYPDTRRVGAARSSRRSAAGLRRPALRRWPSRRSAWVSTTRWGCSPSPTSSPRSRCGPQSGHRAVVICDSRNSLEPAHARRPDGRGAADLATVARRCDAPAVQASRSCVIISDFFDPRGIEHRRSRH